MGAGKARGAEAPSTGHGLAGSATAAAQLAAIVASSEDAIVAKNLNGLVTSWNPAAQRLFGYAADEAIGQSIRIIIPEARQAEEDDVLRRIVRGDSVKHFETVRRRKDGTSVSVSLTMSPIFDAGGAITGGIDNCQRHFRAAPCSGTRGVSRGHGAAAGSLARLRGDAQEPGSAHDECPARIDGAVRGLFVD